MHPHVDEGAKVGGVGHYTFEHMLGYRPYWPTSMALGLILTSSAKGPLAAG